MKYFRKLLCLLLLISSISYAQTPVFSTKNLRIEQISERVYVHISYLNSDDYGKVACNGMLVIDEQEAIVFDTPVDSLSSAELINWLHDTMESEIKAVIATHFHIDCLGGLEAFHEENIPSYANKLSIKLARKMSHGLIPLNAFDGYHSFQIGNEKIESDFLGEGHTRGNTIAYFAGEGVIFGGCLIKHLGAGNGNLADANTDQWSETVEKIKLKYPETKIVIPGHGKVGGIALLDYTIDKFKRE